MKRCIIVTKANAVASIKTRERAIEALNEMLCDVRAKLERAIEEPFISCEKHSGLHNIMRQCDEVVEHINTVRGLTHAMAYQRGELGKLQQMRRNHFDL